MSILNCKGWGADTPLHVSNVMCHVSDVMCQVSSVIIFFLKVAEFVSGGSDINGAYPVWFCLVAMVTLNWLLCSHIGYCITILYKYVSNIGTSVG